MKRLVAVLSVVLSSLLAVPALAGASPSPGGPDRDFAVGGGFTGSEANDPFGAQHVGFAAFGGPTTFDPLTKTIGGDPVTGHFRAGGEFLDPPGGNNEVGEFQQEGPVTCLAVKGNQARLVYPIKQGRPAVNEANEVLIVLQDNGKPRGGQSPDEIGFLEFPDETPFDDPPSEQDQECVAPAVTPAMSKLTHGDITVHDAP